MTGGQQGWVSCEESRSCGAGQAGQALATIEEQPYSGVRATTCLFRLVLMIRCPF